MHFGVSSLIILADSLTFVWPIRSINELLAFWTVVFGGTEQIGRGVRGQVSGMITFSCLVL